MKYLNLQTNDEIIVKFPILWVINPVCTIELIAKGKIILGILGLLPIFNLILMYQYKEILGSALEERGYIRIE
tara:strand:+ start:327 stop:545 length:219 start_codon:yes stop_codon:yes gene_type:complete